MFETIHSKFSSPTEWRSASGAQFMKSIASCAIIVRSRVWSYAAKNSFGSCTLYTSFHPPPYAGFMKIGHPRYDHTSSQFTQRMLRNDFASVLGGYCLCGSSTVFGTATFAAFATRLSKNLSSADHQIGLLTMRTPDAAAHLRYVR